ncbi:MAG: ABC transporter ATP-binding protein [Betaproteobacteria bacterium]
MASIVLERVEKIFAGGASGVRGISVEIADGELVVLVGPSGSGKSTTLRLVAGLEMPTAGRILIGGRDVTGAPPQARDLAMVFQSYALYPHKTVRDNLAFGLRVRGVPRPDIDARIDRAARVLQIDELLERRPAQLSGGQRQRVALGRAIVREPQAFLLDEPLSNLDPALRLQTRAELALLHQRLGATMVYVTHDQEEAMTLGDRIVVMRDGRVEQTGAPSAVYREPSSTFVARFVGSPPMNLLEGPVPALGIGADAVAGIRPHDLTLAPSGDPEADAVGSIELLEPLGSELRVHLRVDLGGAIPRLVAVVPPDTPASPGDRVGVRVRRDRLHVFDKSTGRRVMLTP